MSTVAKQATEIAVNTVQKSVTYIANTMFQVFIRITSERHLGPGYITQNREIIENGLFVWLAEQTLEWACLEVFCPGIDQALERWDFQFSYVHTVQTELDRPPINGMTELCQKLRSLPTHAKYRIVVTTARGATEVPGWSPTKLRDLDESESQELEAWGYGNVSVKLTYKGGGKA